MPRDFKSKAQFAVDAESFSICVNAAFFATLTHSHLALPLPFFSSSLLPSVAAATRKPPSSRLHPLIHSHVTSALCVTLCDPAPAVRFLAVSAVQHLITVAGINIDDAPQLLPPLCMNRFHHADGVKAAAQVGIRSHGAALTNSTAITLALLTHVPLNSQSSQYSAHHSSVNSPRTVMLARCRGRPWPSPPRPSCQVYPSMLPAILSFKKLHGPSFFEPLILRPCSAAADVYTSTCSSSDDAGDDCPLDA